MMSKSETEKKLEFLHRLLEKNPDLQNQYEAFVREKAPASGDETDAESFLMIQTGKLVSELEKLILDDPDWEDYTPRHSGYIEEWEAIMHMAEDMVAEVFDAYMAEIEARFAAGRTDLALLLLVSGYNACLQAEIQDEYDSLGDAQSFLIETMRELQLQVIQKMDTIVFSNRQVFFFTDALFSHFNIHHQNNEMYLRFFEPLLLALARDRECAVQIERGLEENEIPRQYIPRLATALYKVMDNKEKWREEAEYLFEVDAEVARDLLTEYCRNSYDDFIRVARQLWHSGKFRQELASFIFEHIKREQSPEFYKDVLIWLTSTGRTMARYKLLRTILTDQEKEEFIDTYKRDHQFYTGMLQQEQRYEEILQFIRRNRDSWHLNKMLATILEPFPKESFEILEQKILTTLETGRGRHVYRQIVEWLQLAKQIKQMEAGINHLIYQLYHRKPALPALKDEMRKAGIRPGGTSG
jgi:hypothetical protein